MSNIFDLTGRILISALFIISAYNKVLSIDGTMSWMEGFGVPGFLLFPVILEIYSLTKYSKKRSDFFLFIFPYFVQEYAFRYGEFKGLFNILRKK